MEQKPIKRNKHILQLSKDHHFVLLFCWKIRQGLKHKVSAERIKSYVRHFWLGNMQTHFREEEKILFAADKGEGVQKAIGDHRQIAEQINLVLKSSAEETSIQLSQLADLVDAHVRYEERELFPHLEKAISETELENIGKYLYKEPVLKDEFKDEFWVKG